MVIFFLPLVFTFFFLFSLVALITIVIISFNLLQTENRLWSSMKRIHHFLWFASVKTLTRKLLGPANARCGVKQEPNLHLWLLFGSSPVHPKSNLEVASGRESN